MPYGASLDELHCVIQCTMGWNNSHLYNFEINNQRFECTDTEFLGDTDHEQLCFTDSTLEEIALKAGDQFRYTYDFGDSWTHLIEVE